MILLQSNPIDAARYITHPISLVAYACALVVYYFVSKNINDRRKLKENPETYVKIAERLHIDLNKIPKNERSSIVMRILKNRITSQLITASSLIIGGLILSYIFINYLKNSGPISSTKEEQNQATDSLVLKDTSSKKGAANPEPTSPSKGGSSVITAKPKPPKKSGKSQPPVSRNPVSPTTVVITETSPKPTYEDSYFAPISSDERINRNPDFDINTTGIAQSRRGERLYFITYEKIGLKIGVVEINSDNNTVTIKLTNSNEHFDKANGKILTNFLIGEEKYVAYKGSIIKLIAKKIDKSGRDKAFFNLKVWKI